MRVVVLLLLAVLSFGCGPGLWPSERTCFKVAQKTLQSDSALPAGLQWAPARQVEIYVVKNAARVDWPYTVSSSAGGTESGVYVVWLKRIARRWELDYYYRKGANDGMPAASNAPAATGAAATASTPAPQD